MPFWPNISLDIPVLSIIIAMSKLPVVHIVKANRRNRMPVESKVSKGATGIPFMKSISFMRIVILLPCFSIRDRCHKTRKDCTEITTFSAFQCLLLTKSGEDARLSSSPALEVRSALGMLFHCISTLQTPVAQGLADIHDVVVAIGNALIEKSLTFFDDSLGERVRQREPAEIPDA